MTRAIVAVLSMVLFPATPDQDKKREIPDEAALKDAEKTVRDLFKPEYAKRAPADRIALAKNLLKQASETRDNPAARYVLFREAQDIAARAGDIETAFKAIQELAMGFEVNPIALKNTALGLAAAVAKTPEESKALATASLTLADEAVEARQFDIAAKAAQAAVAPAKRAKDVALASKAESQAKTFGALQEKFEKVRKSVEVLASKPDDPDANLAVGEFECFFLGDWPAGIPKLAKGSDPTLQVLAGKELAKVTEGADQVAIGDLWWERSEKDTGLSKANLRQRAAFWYEQASRSLTGLSKAKVDRRLEDLKNARGSGEGPTPKNAHAGIDMLALVDLQKDALRGMWTSTPQGLLSPVDDIAYVQLPYVPGEEYDLTVVAQRKDGGNSLNIGLAVGADKARHQAMLVLDGGPGGDGSGIGSAVYQGRLLGDPKHPYGIVCQVRKTGVAVLIDGKKILDYQGDLGALGMGTQWVLPSKETSFVGSWTTRFLISKVTLTPVSGQGKKLR